MLSAAVRTKNNAVRCWSAPNKEHGFSFDCFPALLNADWRLQ